MSSYHLTGFWFLISIYFCFRCRGKLISHNEYKSENTTIELIDFGSFYQTKLENVFNLPYYYTYGQLVSKILSFLL